MRMQRLWVVVAIVLASGVLLWLQQDDAPWVWVDGEGLEGTPLVVERGGWRKLGSGEDWQRWAWKVELRNDSADTWRGTLTIDGALIEQEGVPVVRSDTWSEPVTLSEDGTLDIYRREAHHRGEFVDDLKPQFRVWARWGCTKEIDEDPHFPHIDSMLQGRRQKGDSADPWTSVDSVFGITDSTGSNVHLTTCYSDTLRIRP